MPSIPDNFIDDLNTRVDLAELIGRYLTLKKVGSRYKGICPFHGDTDPSLSVNPEKGFFYCYGCNAGGDAISFIRKIENLDFVESVKFIANLYGIPVPESNSQHEGRRKSLYEINSAAKELFRKHFSSGKEGAPFRAYMLERGFLPDTLKVFEVGAAPESWDFAKIALNEYGDENLIKSGIVVKHPEKGNIYDRFRYRLMIPIIDTLGRVAGFGGRIMKGDGPKYINSPESDIFKKSKILFGLNHAKDACRESGDLIVMEGYTDVMMCCQAGLKNSCAVMGIALTEEHIPILRRFAKRVILLFDGDKAGTKAAARSVSSMVNSGIKVLVAHIGNGNDPASVVHESGPDAIKSIIEKAVEGDEWLLSTLAKPVANKPLKDKMKMLASAAGFIGKHESEPIRDELIEKATIYFKVPASAIQETMRDSKDGNKKTSSANIARMVNNIEKVERDFLMAALNHPETFPELSKMLDQNDFDVPIHKRAFMILIGMDQSEIEILARDRDEHHSKKEHHRPLGEDYMLVGMTGEKWFEDRYGVKFDRELRQKGDGGADFIIGEWKIDIKTARLPKWLIVEKGHVKAEIYVLAKYDDMTMTANFIGWEYAIEIKDVDPIDITGSGIINHWIPADKLRGLKELDALIQSAKE